MIDSPGLLDRPLEKRNTIEMQSITALAHLKCCILYFIDISSSNSENSVESQIKLFNGIKEIFRGKPMVLVMTKTDLKNPDSLLPEEKLLIKNIQKEFNATLLSLSNKSGEGIFKVKSQACDILQQYRASLSKEVTTGGLVTLKQEEDFLKGIYIAYPTKRDGKERPPTIPKPILEGKPLKLDRPTLKELQEKYGGSGVFNFPKHEHFILEKPEWKYDEIP